MMKVIMEFQWKKLIYRLINKLLVKRHCIKKRSIPGAFLLILLGDFTQWPDFLPVSA